MNKQLQTVSHVIELKKNKKYIFVFEKNVFSKADMKSLFDTLVEQGITTIGLVLTDINGLRVFEKEV